MEVNVNIAESQNQITRLIINAISEELNGALSKAALPMEKRIRTLVSTAISDQPEWISLNGGDLQQEFGLTSVSGKLNTIMRIWINNIVVIFDKFKPSGNFLRGRFEISMIKADWSDVLTSQESKQITGKGQVLPWLEWLLTQGDKTIIRDYEIGYGLKPGRAGGKIMIKGRGKWNVPRQFAGTTNDNFVTRAIDQIATDFEQIFIDEVIKRL